MNGITTFFEFFFRIYKFIVVKCVFVKNDSGKVSHISLGDSSFSWNVLALDGDNIIAGKSRCIFQFILVPVIAIPLIKESIIFFFWLKSVVVPLMFLQSSMGPLSVRHPQRPHGVG